MSRAGLDVREAHVDVQSPALKEVVRELEAAGRESVVVPLMLGAGYHVQVDISDAVDATRARAADPLGPHPALASALRARLAAAGVAPDTAVVLAAAGSSRAASEQQTRDMAAILRAERAGPVVAAFGSAAYPRVGDAVTALREAGERRVAIAAYLIGRGFFFDRLCEAGADVVSEPLGAHPAVVARVLELYDAATSPRTWPMRGDVAGSVS
ncbi:sirohydrochlorin chelatase [Epidermidibacterium keratini]